MPCMKKHYMKALAPLRYFTFSSGLPVVLTPPSTRQVADARNTNSSKVPKRSVGLYKWSMAFPSVLPVKIERVFIKINYFWIRIKFAIVYVHDTCFFFSYIEPFSWFHVCSLPLKIFIRSNFVYHFFSKELIWNFLCALDFLHTSLFFISFC